MSCLGIEFTLGGTLKIAYNKEHRKESALWFNGRLKIGVGILALYLFNIIKIKRRMFSNSKHVTLITCPGITISCALC